MCIRDSCWSFPREDVSRETIAKQIALALRDEVADLEAAGIGIIQIDEPALREGLPLRRSDWDAYLQWGVEAFRINCLLYTSQPVCPAANAPWLSTSGEVD